MSKSMKKARRVQYLNVVSHKWNTWCQVASKAKAERAEQHAKQYAIEGQTRILIVKP